MNARKQTPADISLHDAIRCGNAAAAVAAIDAGADVNGRGAWGSPALSDAVRAGRIEMVALLLDRGADIHGVCAAFFTALHVAVQERCFGIARLLIDRGADVDFQVNPGYSNAPLHIAIYADSKTEAFERIEFLLAQGADPEVKMHRDGQAYAASAYAGASHCPRAAEIDAFIGGWTARQAAAARMREKLEAARRLSKSRFKL